MRLPLFLLAALLLASGDRPCEAYPTGAAQCISGSNAPGGPHSGNNKGDTEPDYSVGIDGYGDFAFSGMTLQVPAGEDLTLKLSSKDDKKAFKGFLIRLHAAVDVSGSLSNPSNSPDIQIMESTGEAVGAFPAIGTCDEMVSGATHTADADSKAYDKMEVSATLNVDPAALDPENGIRTLTIEVTVVTKKDEYYYSAWPLIVKSSMDPETPMPSAPQVPAPTPAVEPTEPTGVAPAPEDIGDVCSADNMQGAGYWDCARACVPATCCGDGSCLEPNCAGYAPCLVLAGVDPPIPDPPLQPAPEDIGTVCSADNVGDGDEIGMGYLDCAEICIAATCCNPEMAAEGVEPCATDPNCPGYAPCVIISDTPGGETPSPTSKLPPTPSPIPEPTESPPSSGKKNNALGVGISTLLAIVMSASYI